MTQQIKKGDGDNTRSTTQKDAVADIADDPSLPCVSDSQATPDTIQLIEENKRLRNRIEQLEKSQKRTLLKGRQIEELKPYQAELIRLQQCLEKSGKKLIIIFEGRGGAGKGGTIRRITHYMNAKHYRVVAFGKPTEKERSQWFYQKYIREFPVAGDIVLFHRSWYKRALIESMFNFCTPTEYQNFMEGVGGFEMNLVEQNIILVKLYFSVTREERARRFKQRRGDPLQSWKLNEVDLELEEHADEFTEAKYKMLRHTHTMYAPWTIIRSDIKHLSRMNAMKVILSAIDYERLDPKLDIIPDPSIAISGAYELEMMEAQRLRQGKNLEPLDAFCGGGEALTTTIEGDNI